MTTRVTYLGLDDWGNQVFYIFIYDPRDPDVNTGFVHTEWAY